MKTVTITETFYGYPNGTKRLFEKGAVEEVSNEFADLIVGKRHAREDEPRVVDEAPAAKPTGKK